jgi:hypothetical protein
MTNLADVIASEAKQSRVKRMTSPTKNHGFSPLLAAFGGRGGPSTFGSDFR